MQLQDNTIKKTIQRQSNTDTRPYNHKKTPIKKNAHIRPYCYKTIQLQDYNYYMTLTFHYHIVMNQNMKQWDNMLAYNNMQPVRSLDRTNSDCCNAIHGYNG